MLAEHHLRLVLQSLHMLRILQASRLWREAVPVSSLPKACLIPQPPKYQATPLFSAPPPPEEDYPPIPRWVYEEPSRRRSPEPLNPSSSFFPQTPNHVSEKLGPRLSTGFEEDQGLHAGKLCGVYCQCAEPGDGLLQEAHLFTGQDQPALRAARGLGWCQQWAAIQGQRPLYGSKEEKLIPCLFQQDHLLPERVQASAQVRSS